LEEIAMSARKCERCGENLCDEDVMKVIFEDGSCEIFPFSKCPKCFREELIKKAQK